MNRQLIFDRNRNIEEEMAEPNNEHLQELIRRQEEMITEMQQQIRLQQQQINEPQRTQQHNRRLSTMEILQQFRQLRSLDKNHNVLAFINSVEAVMALCPSDDIELAKLAMSIVANDKIIGEAANYVQELGINATWEEIKAKLLDQYRPRYTYGDVFMKFRNLKVCNLRELFEFTRKSKFEINQLYLYDEDKPTLYKPECVERDLVNIIIDKIDIPMRTHSDKQCSLNQLITRYTQIEALDDYRVIHLKYRKNNKLNNNQKTNSNNTDGNNPNFQDNNQSNFDNIRKYQNQEYNNQNDNNNRNPRNTNNYRQNPRNNNRNERQSYGQQFSTDNRNSGENISARTRNSHMSVDTQNVRSINQPTYMEVDTIQEGIVNEDGEVNFLTLPQGLRFP